MTTPLIAELTAQRTARLRHEAAQQRRAAEAARTTRRPLSPGRFVRRT